MKYNYLGSKFCKDTHVVMKRVINKMDKHKNHTAHSYNGEMFSIVNTLNKLMIPSTVFTQYKSTEFNRYGISFAESFKAFIKTYLEILNHPSLFFEWEKTLI